jgi:hypothetical protein
LSGIENQEFLCRKAKSIGTLVSPSVANRAVQVAKQRIIRGSWRQFVRDLLKQHNNTKRDINSDTTYTETKKDLLPSSFLHKLWLASDMRLYVYLSKFTGGNGQVAPSLNFTQTLWTLLGACGGVILLSAYNEWIQESLDGKYESLIGPFAAAMTLFYGLHSAGFAATQ